jgi:hypothetical protein
MTSRELEEAYDERRNIRNLLERNPNDSNVVQQIKVNDEKIDQLEQTEKTGKYKIKPE